MLYTEIHSNLLITIIKQTNKILQAYISKAGCCLDHGRNQNE